MKFFTPTVRQQIKLLGNCTFPLHLEYRNRSLLHLTLEPRDFDACGSPGGCEQ